MHIFRSVARVLCLVGLIGFVAGCRTTTSRDSTAWRPLFDGTSTNGWQMVGPGEVRFESGELVTYGGMGLLWYAPEKFGDCEIRVVFKLTAPDDNAGVFIRIPEPPDNPWTAVHQGYEVQIDNTGDEFHRTGCLYSLTRAQNIVSPQPGEWTEMRIVLDGPRTTVDVNGLRVTDYTEGYPVPPKTIWYEPDRGRRPNSGYIGLQNHGGEARVHFREVSVRPIR